jgi:hypothetical protein
MYWQNRVLASTQMQMQDIWIKLSYIWCWSLKWRCWVIHEVPNILIPVYNHIEVCPITTSPLYKLITPMAIISFTIKYISDVSHVKYQVKICSYKCTYCMHQTSMITHIITYAFSMLYTNHVPLISNHCLFWTRITLPFITSRFTPSLYVVFTYWPFQ